MINKIFFNKLEMFKRFKSLDIYVLSSLNNFEKILLLSKLTCKIYNT